MSLISLIEYDWIAKPCYCQLQTPKGALSDTTTKRLFNSFKALLGVWGLQSYRQLYVPAK